MKANQIIKVLQQLKNSSYKSVLIDGNWGIGKTKYVMEFKQEYSNSCYISLFGKKDISIVLQELYFCIIKDEPSGKLKKSYRYVSEKLNNIKLSYHGLSISIPLIADLHKSINNKLGKKSDYIVILDDLERKHDDLGMEEILGLIDSLSKIDGIKTVLVAAKDQLNDEDAQKFINYREKTIDRIYTVTDYAVEAPKEILGNDVWKTINRNVETFKDDFKNLRTFEKTNLFIKEVVDVVGVEVFTDKFTKADLYRMCFATVFFNIEHKNEMRLLIEKDQTTKLRNAVYRKGDHGTVSYLCSYILNDSLDNTMSKNVFIHIKNWFEKGTYSREHICNVIASINNFKPQATNFYSSEQEILKVIEHSREYIKNLDKNENLSNIITIVLNGFAWSEVLGIDYGISNEEIIALARENISNGIDINKQIHENEIHLGSFNRESKNAEPLIRKLNKFIKTEYYNQLIKNILDTFSAQSYDNYYSLRQLQGSVHSIRDEQIRDNILISMKENDFFFPLPSGTINDALWSWCHLVNLFIKDIEKEWNLTNLYEEFKTYNYKRKDSQKDKMLKYRLDSLFNRTPE
ncbi:KAP family NTPase [Priestia megaterium]|uniref:KAP family NTPase n=1 Tax=Priestia megaterium TaxID=1404 RepID=UPI001C228140|nr:KAP family NTPase [Priestia megaterium]MBU8757310.1 KAP family NTPase [Priestia megaterium]